jgi:hypothetical protein
MAISFTIPINYNSDKAILHFVSVKNLCAETDFREVVNFLIHQTEL